jgi:hypothetical protein
MREPEHSDPLSSLPAANPGVITSGDESTIENLKDATMTNNITQERFGFPKQHGQSQSYWLHRVQGDALLNHRTTPDLPSSADIVIIGSGVSASLRVTTTNKQADLKLC